MGAPVAEVYVPLRQSSQSVDAADSWNMPALHAAQAMLRGGEGRG
jgi:hypothetical protein